MIATALSTWDALLAADPDETLRIIGCDPNGASRGTVNQQSVALRPACWNLLGILYDSATRFVPVKFLPDDYTPRLILYYYHDHAGRYCSDHRGNDFVWERGNCFRCEVARIAFNENATRLFQEFCQ